MGGIKGARNFVEADSDLVRSPKMNALSIP